MSTPAEQWEKLTNQKLSDSKGLAPQGMDLPPPPLPGSGPQPVDKGHLPGFGPIHFALVQSFLVGKNPDDISETVMNAIISACARLADKLLASYPGYLPVSLNATLPENWKKG